MQNRARREGPVRSRVTRLCGLLMLAASGGVVGDDAGGAEPAQSQAPGVISLPQPDPAPLPHPVGVVELDPIVVTATKRIRDLRDLPPSVDVRSGTELDHLGAIDLRSVVDTIPGVDLTEVFGDYSRIAIRGMQTDSTAVTPAATGFFIDDVPLTDPFTLHARPDLPPFDLESVEILKGPQGTLFGGSALAGALRFRLRDAQPGLSEGAAFTQRAIPVDGAPHEIHGAAMNIPLGRTAALRFAGVQRRLGGRIDDLRNGIADTDDRRSLMGRALLRFDAGGDWSLGLKTFRQELAAADLSLAETTNGELTRERALRAAPYLTRTAFTTADATRRFAWGEVVTVMSQVRKSADHTGRFGERVLAIEDLGQPVDVPFREDIQGRIYELRLVSADDVGATWQWLMGLYAYDYDDVAAQSIIAYDPLLSTPLSLLDFDSDLVAQERALFVEISRSLGQRWRVTLGLRGYRARTAGETVSTGPIILATGSPENRNVADLRESGINPKLALAFAPIPQLEIHAQVARGFRFGGVQIVGSSPLTPDVSPSYRADEVWAYELGWRSEWFDGRLTADGALYYNDWTDPQLQSTTGGAVPLNTIDNVSHAVSQGAELTIAWRPRAQGFGAQLAGNYVDARLTEDYVGPNDSLAVAGSRLPGSARHTLAATLDYTLRRGSLDMGLSLSHTRYGPGQNDLLGTLSILDYDSTDIRLFVAPRGGGGWPRASIGVANIADNRALTGATVVDTENLTNITSTYNPTRTADLRFDWRW